MSVVLIDGVSASGKSVALQNLQRMYAKTLPNYSKWIITEHLTERYFEGKAISEAAVEQHIQSILNAVQHFKALHSGSPFSEKAAVFTVYIERLLLSFYSRNLLQEHTLGHLAKLCSQLEGTHYLLTIPPGKFKERLADTLERRNPLWSAYIHNTLGGLDQAVVHFQKQQDALLRGHAILSKYMKAIVITVDDIAGDFYKDLQ